MSNEDNQQNSDGSNVFSRIDTRSKLGAIESELDNVLAQLGERDDVPGPPSNLDASQIEALTRRRDELRTQLDQINTENPGIKANLSFNEARKEIGQLRKGQDPQQNTTATAANRLTNVAESAKGQRNDPTLENSDRVQARRAPANLRENINRAGANLNRVGRIASKEFAEEKAKQVVGKGVEKAAGSLVGNDTVQGVKALRNFSKDKKGAVKAGAKIAVKQGLHLLLDSIVPGSWEAIQIIWRIPLIRGCIRSCGVLILVVLVCFCCFMCFLIYGTYKSISEGKLDSIFKNGVCVLTNSNDTDKAKCVIENKLNDYKQGNFAV